MAQVQHVRAMALPMDESVFANTFPALDAKVNSRLRMLWIVCVMSDRPHRREPAIQGLAEIEGRRIY